VLASNLRVLMASDFNFVWLHNLPMPLKMHLIDRGAGGRHRFIFIV